MTRIHRSARPLARPILAALAVLALPACASTYTGPVEVTRFVSERPAMLGEGTITLVFPEEIDSPGVRNAFAAAVAEELSQIGYEVVMDGRSAGQTAAIRTSRGDIAAATERRGPVSVGVGGGTGTFGSGVGLGVGINLGGGRDEANVLTELSVRIDGPSGEALWEGRARHPISVESDYADVDLSARTLAAALFRDFPGGNGETVTIDVDQLQGQLQGSQ
ncbi:MAG: hypothetical protein WA936_04470 [Erythrobacter sp.]